MMSIQEDGGELLPCCSREITSPRLSICARSVHALQKKKKLFQFLPKNLWHTFVTHKANFRKGQLSRGGGRRKKGRTDNRRLRQATRARTFAICINDMVPSCILAPPERHCTTTGSRCSSPYSKALVIFSPSACPRDPPARTRAFGFTGEECAERALACGRLRLA